MIVRFKTTLRDSKQTVLHAIQILFSILRRLHRTWTHGAYYH